MCPAKGAEPGWQTFVCTNDVPKVVQKEDAALQRQLQVYPRPDGVGFFEVDDVAVEPLDVRRHVRARYPEHYYDCLRFLQRDTALRTRNEMATVRKAVPGVPVTVDVRGHHAYTDGYMAYDPEAIASLEDIFHVHCGFFAYEYNNTPVHVPTLCDATAYPLFAYNYFVRNTTKPVVQSEDIISRAGLPGSDGEAMAENDMARDSPLTEGVAKVNLFTLSPLVAHKGPDVVPVVRIPETADNAALLENVVGWLLRERVTPEMRATFKANLFVTKEAME